MCISGVNAEAARRATVAVVDPHPADYAVLASASPTLRWRWLATGRQALRLARQEAVQLWMFNSTLDDMSGTELCAMIKTLRPESAVYIIADEYSAAEERAAWACGATLFACKPARAEWLDSRAIKFSSCNHIISKES
jgi:DNA-binding response OmpR family regulator